LLRAEARLLLHVGHGRQDGEELDGPEHHESRYQTGGGDPAEGAQDEVAGEEG